MSKILMTGMCSVHDRAVAAVEHGGIRWKPFAEPVRTYADVRQQFRIASNTGNFLISEGACHALEGHDVHYLPFWLLHQLHHDKEFMERLHAEHDLCLFVTANILNREIPLHDEVAVLQAMRLPLIFMSVGLQRRDDLNGPPSAGLEGFLEVLRRPDAHVFTRGAETARFLARQGVQQVTQACCPSAFHRAEKVIRAVNALAEPDAQDLHEVWVNGYFGLDAQAGRDIRSLSMLAPELSYVMQDELLLAEIYRNGNEPEGLYDDASCRFSHLPVNADSEGVPGDVSFRAFFSPEQWRARASCVGLSVGRRFHGNLVAMQVGCPAAFIIHDDRVREMLESIGMPAIEAEEWASSEDVLATLSDFRKRVEPARFEDCFRARERVFRDTLHALIH